MNAHQRRKAVRAIRNGKMFRGYGKHKYLHLIIVNAESASRQRGRYKQFVRKAFGLA